MQTSISTLFLPGDIAGKLAAIANAGFDGVDLSEQEIVANGGDAAELGALVTDFGLKVSTFRPLPDFGKICLPLDRHSRALVGYRSELMKSLKTNALTVKDTDFKINLDGGKTLDEAIEALANFCAELNIDLIIKRDFKRGRPDHFSALYTAVANNNSNHIGFALDSFCLAVEEPAHDLIADVSRQRVKQVILSDAPQQSMDVALKYQEYRCLPGEGELPIASFLDTLLAEKLEGWFSISISEDRAQQGNMRALPVDAYRALLCVFDQCHDLTNAPFKSMPQRSSVDGIEFIEFAANQTEAMALRQQFAALGFSRVGDHMNREVELWRQNEINLVLNTEKHGFAHSCNVLHGTCVCDIGLLVDDAQNAVERARAFGVKPFGQSRQRGELNIPAVRGVGGSALHFLDRKSELSAVWDKEFIPRGNHEAEGAGLSKIDHIAQVMRTDELPGWAMFYHALFDFSDTSHTQIRDPGGLVQSHALESRNGEVRFTLNGNNTHKTLAGRFVTDRKGPSVQHVAFHTDDIFKTALVLQDNGFPVLQMPQLYFDELRVRHELDDEFVAALQNANILYDQDEAGGQYFQLYSQPQRNGFFFEIVERVKGYEGYGARNAPFRTVALKQSVAMNG